MVKMTLQKAQAIGQQFVTSQTNKVTSPYFVLKQQIGIFVL
jgi:hypothetical protein